MSKFNPDLLYIRSTDKNKYVCLNIETTQHLYILNKEEINDSTFSEKEIQNKTAFKYIENNELMHNMYDTQDVFYKSAIYEKSKSIRDNTTYDFKNIFSHNLSSSLNSIIQVNNTLYSYEKLSEYGHIEISSDSYSCLSNDNGLIKLPNKIIETYTYNKDIVLQLVNFVIDPENYHEKPEQGAEIDKTLKGILYNTIFEIPGSIQNDYDSGNIAANSFKGKNHLNSLFDMSHDRSYILKNAREYVGIGNCNNLIFLKYYDYIHYKEVGNNIIKDDRKKEQIYQLKIPQIETFAYISRYANLNGHKSNLYSLRINSLILNKANLVDIENDILEKIKTNIKVQVRNIVEKILPAHTLLFKIYI